MAAAVTAWPTSVTLEERRAARLEAARDRRHGALEAAAAGLAERVDRALALARGLADGAAAPALTLSATAPAPDARAWRTLDEALRDPAALAPRERRAARQDGVLLAAVYDDAGAPLAALDRRGLAARPLRPAPPPAAVERARAVGEALDLEAAPRPALVAAHRLAPGLVAVVALDAGDDLQALARAADAEAAGPAAWRLADGARPLAGGGGEGVLGEAPGPERRGTWRDGDAFASTLAVGRAGWLLRARAPAASAPEPLERVLLGLSVVVPAVVVLLALGWRREAAARERGLRERERFLAAVVDAIGDALVVVDRDLVVRRANAAAVKRLGRDLVGRLYTEAVAARRAAPQAEVEALRAVLARGRARVDDAEEPASRSAWQVVRFPILDPEGAAAGVVELARDVTETRRLQAQLVQSEKLSTLGEMAAGIAHEVNNPVGVVSMFAQLALEDVRGALGEEHPALEKLRTIEEQATAIGDIVKGLLRFSRKSEGVRARLDVRASVERALAILAHQRAHRGVTVERALDVTPAPEVLGDEGQLAQVVLNLAVNASHAMKGQGTLRVSLGRRGEADPYPPGRPFGEVTGNPARVEVRVQDTGHGIPPEVLERLFEPFFTTKPSGEGTGLGLSVSFAIVRDHGGCMWVHSEVGAGTTFTVDLPAAPAAP